MGVDRRRALQALGGGGDHPGAWRAEAAGRPPDTMDGCCYAVEQRRLEVRAWS